jgi:bacterioferritin
MASGEETKPAIKKATSNEEISELLIDDMKGEHAAIIQYLQHAYKIGDENPISPEIEAIARDEMRHFRWLGELIVEFGAAPTLLRDPVFLDGPSTTDLLALDIDAEQRAIDQYLEHIEAIDHPKVKLYLRRIVMDEMYHQGKFKHFMAEMGGDPEKEVDAPDTGPWNKNPAPGSNDLELNANGQAVPADMESENRDDHPLVKMLNNRIQSEYETILIYLHQAFVSQNPDQRNHLISDRAVWHMTHMGTLSEAVAEMDHDNHPNMELNFEEPFLKQAPTDARSFNQWSLQREQYYVENSAQLLAQANQEVTDDEGLIADLKRLEGHNKFQVEQVKLYEEE